MYIKWSHLSLKSPPLCEADVHIGSEWVKKQSRWTMYTMCLNDTNNKYKNTWNKSNDILLLIFILSLITDFIKYHAGIVAS